MRWQKPSLIILSGSSNRNYFKHAYGDCVGTGSGDVGTCGANGMMASDCNNTGFAASDWCHAGNLGGDW